MFAAYSFYSGSSAANILADVVALLTGTTNKTLLSAACNKAASSIVNSYDSAGWVMHDAAAGTNRVVLSSACADGSTTKYLIIEATTDGYLNFGSCESWNSSTHTGTNYNYGTMLPSSINIYFSSSAGVLYISSSNRGVALSHKTTADIIATYIIVLEWERTSALMLLAAGYPCWGGLGDLNSFTNNNTFNIPRIKNHAAAGDLVGSSALVTLLRLGAINGSTVGGSLYPRSVTDSTYIEVADEFYAATTNSAGGYPIAVLGKALKKMFGLEAGVDLDEIVVNGFTFIRLGAISNYPALWVLKG